MNEAKLGVREPGKEQRTVKEELDQFPGMLDAGFQERRDAEVTSIERVLKGLDNIMTTPMQERTRAAIEAHIERVLQATNFENFRRIVPEGCPCNKPGSRLCHRLPESRLNCLFCYCPEYRHDLEEGGCRIGSSQGKWFHHEALEKGRIWDCSDCDYPQRPEVVREYLRKIFQSLYSS